MINSLSAFNKIIRKSVLHSKPIQPSSVYNALKSYNGIDWQKVMYIKKMNDDYSEAFMEDNNLIIKLIKWHPNYEGGFHNHDNYQCYFKVLDGVLCENVRKLEENYKHIYKPNMIGYISDTIGDHKITNLSDDFSYSINVYYRDLH